MTERGTLMCEALKGNGIEYIIWLPDSESHFMHEAMLSDPALKIVQVCREGEAFGIAAGLHMAGKRAVLLIENQGLFDSGNALRWAIDLSFPIVLLVGYLFYRQLEDTPQGKIWRNPMWQGAKDVTEPFLAAYDVPYFLIRSDADISRVSDAFAAAARRSRPAVLLLTSADNFAGGVTVA